ncbi:MAG: carbohydrate ABC transporter permease [Anaerolineae bacterium]|nr:carbohydrate ABC transporter permease [Anaerolineae bacterium]
MLERKYLLPSLRYIVLVAVSLFMAGPILTAFLGSIRTTGEFLAQPFGLPVSGIHWENYTTILQSPTFWRALGNSAYITIATTLLVVTLASMLALVFARIRFTGRSFLFNILTLGLLFPLVVAILPVFIQIRQFGLLDNVWGVILPLTTFGMPGAVVILRGFFRAIPNELEDAAYIDGCSTFSFFLYILLPLARPAIAAVATLQVIYSWNEFLLPLIVLNDPNRWPLPLGMMQFQGQFSTDWALIMAYVMILIVPAIVFYLFTERFIVTGLTGGELKG